MTDVIPTLAVVGALAVNYLNTTHGVYLGHDHHCPIPYTPVLTTPTPEDVERCTCGWATFYGAYLKVTEGAGRG